MSHSQKTKKALLKRIKITAGKKILKRPNHQNHFNAKENSNQSRAKHGDMATPHSLIKDVKALISNF